MLVLGVVVVQTGGRDEKRREGVGGVLGEVVGGVVVV